MLEHFNFKPSPDPGQYDDEWAYKKDTSIVIQRGLYCGQFAVNQRITDDDGNLCAVKHCSVHSSLIDAAAVVVKANVTPA